ncbi:uncharacterized protein MELLADRAFT_68462 [Melampsora larici-populina 98AG31]|uniref:Uncharacterized protein n=1 Tax=Melampsora larici-populina (strain 98AG31 / pathotype 3-4-7) TaxID=747676 RepID=F4S6W7_MELLP|nr:uncharacterized protein MELLADRAFT_68462 [Melampsora larici-populina 98AG31]EGF99653.1 hypothetical protein MELLADRAFT_68462 [Melampsora larici-populina 98AG31]
MCPRFSVIHEIIGHKANVSPHVILDTARSNKLSISALDPPDEIENPMIDPMLDTQFHYDPKDFEIPPEYHHEPLSPCQAPPPTRNTVNFNLKDNNDDIDLSQGSANEDGAQLIRKATRTPTKSKQGAETIANRPMKPLPSVDANPGRNKAPIAAMVNGRDEKLFRYFDRKTEEKKKSGSNLIKSQSKIAEDTLTWDKQKYQTEREAAEKAETLKSQIASELADKNINWEREKLDKEDARLIKVEEA